MLPKYGNTVCFCDDGCLAVALVRATPQGHNLYLLSHIIGMGEGEYTKHVGIKDADIATVLNSFAGIAWVHQQKGAETCLIRIQRDLDGLPTFAIKFDVSPDPQRAFSAAQREYGHKQLS